MWFKKTCLGKFIFIWLHFEQHGTQLSKVYPLEESTRSIPFIHPSETVPLLPILLECNSGSDPQYTQF